MKKKMRLTILMLAGALMYLASAKPSAAGPFCDYDCGLYGPNGEYCCVNPDCSLTCY